MKCAYCKTETDLCKSMVKDGMPEPRTCKECLTKMMRGETLTFDPFTWMGQVKESHGIEKAGELLERLKKEYGVC